MSEARNDTAEARLQDNAVQWSTGRHRGPASPDSPDSPNGETTAQGRHRKAGAPRQET